MNKYFLSPTIFFSFALSACSLAPEFSASANGVARRLEHRCRSRSQIRPEARSRFGRTWEAKSLNRVIEVALAQNLDLEAALYRIEQARRPGKSCRVGAVSLNRCERRRIAYFPGAK